MAFDEYQFLRYFIPGSLFVGYLFLLIIPCLNIETVTYFANNPEFTIGLAGGAFAASPAIGYIIYSLYTAKEYDKDSVLHTDKGINQYLRKKLQFWNDDLPICEKKEFLDFLYYWRDENNQSENYYSKIHGIWSHFVARKVAARYVSISAIVVFFICYFFALGTNSGTVFIYPPTIWFALSFLAIVFISFSLWKHANQTRKEAWQLEFYYLSNKIENSKDDKVDHFEKLVFSFFNKHPADIQSLNITPENLSKFEQLIEKIENFIKPHERSRLLTKIDGLYTLLITLSTFIIGLIISQREVIATNIYVSFPLVGIALCMVSSFIVGVKGMVSDSMEYRTLSYCLLLTLPVWYLGTIILVFVANYLTTSQYQALSTIAIIALSSSSFIISKFFANWFERNLPVLFEKEKAVWKKVTVKTIYILIPVYLLAFVITLAIFWVSFF